MNRSSTWVLVPRVDSRHLLKILVYLNVFLALYLIVTMAPGNYRSPCVVVLNNTSNSNIVVKSPLQETVSLYPSIIQNTDSSVFRRRRGRSPCLPLSLCRQSRMLRKGRQSWRGQLRTATMTANPCRSRPGGRRKLAPLTL